MSTGKCKLTSGSFKPSVRKHSKIQWLEMRIDSLVLMSLQKISRLGKAGVMIIWLYGLKVRESSQRAASRLCYMKLKSSSVFTFKGKKKWLLLPILKMIAILMCNSDIFSPNVEMEKRCLLEIFCFLAIACYLVYISRNSKCSFIIVILTVIFQKVAFVNVMKINQNVYIFLEIF